MKKLIAIVLSLAVFWGVGYLVATNVDAEACVDCKPEIEYKVRLTSMCQLGEEEGLMRFREELGDECTVNWSARYAGGSQFDNGSFNCGETVFFNAPAGKTILVDWDIPEADAKGTETKAQNPKACRIITACIDGQEVEWVFDRDGELPQGATEGDCPAPTPTPEPGEPVEMYSPPEYHAPACTGIGAPKEPTLQLLEVLGGGGIRWRVSQTDSYDKLVFRYGYEPSNLEFGIPDLGVNNQDVVEFNTYGLEPGNHVWGQVGSARQECYSWSAIVDPVIE